MPLRQFTLHFLAALLPLTAAFAAVGAPVHEVLADFERPGIQPLARLAFLPDDGNYYGTTTAGGTYDHGTVFRMTPDGTLTTLVSFTGTGGAARGDSPDGGLVRGPDGSLYGVTLAGGTSDFGTVFKVTSAGVLTTVVDFTGMGGTAKGSVPGELVLDPDDGNFYGTTQAGGSPGFGTLFRMTPAGVLTTLVEFTDTSGTRKGSAPVGALVATGGSLYGVTQTGGSLGFGVVFKYTLLLGSWNVLAEFTGISGGKRGSYPADGLAVHPDGALYGTTEFGGAGDFGTVFRITTAGNFTTLLQFADTDGSQPAGQLVVGADAALYGTTSGGGANGRGTVFKITTPGVHTLLASFSGAGGLTPGDTPTAGLVIGPYAGFYGTTSAGGAGYGTVFEISAAGDFLDLADFTTTNGWQPSGAPAVAVDDSMLLPLSQGGANGGGTLALCLSGGMISVQTPFGGTLGSAPSGAVTPWSSKYYGVTRFGGNGNRGTFFKFTPGEEAETESNLSSTGGANPEGPLTVGPDGNFYVVATQGGSAGHGAVLRFTPTGGRTSIVSFTGTGGAAPGALPHGPLALGADGNFYGATEQGGANNLGTVFQVTPAGVFTTLVTFGLGGPNSPLAGLTAGPDGNFYGTTGAGGLGDHGTLFRVTPAGVFTVLFEFTGTSGSRPGDDPAGPLLAALDGTLYGMTDAGGATGDGTVFKVTPAGTYVPLSALSNTSGARPGQGAGALDFMPDGWLYGVTPRGGPRGGGTVFRLRQLGPHAGTDNADPFGTGGILHGRVQTGGEPTTVSFEYGSTSALGSVATVPATLGPGGSPVSFNYAVSGLTPGQTVYYRATAVNPSGSSSGLTRTFIVPLPYAAWKIAQFGDPNAPDLGDPDYDGIPNLVEYALLLKPNVPDFGGLPPVALKTYAEGRRLRLLVPRDPARNDITVEVQATSSLTGLWTTIATSTKGGPFIGPGYFSGENPDAGTKLVEIRDIVNYATSAPQRFMRIRITH